MRYLVLLLFFITYPLFSMEFKDLPAEVHQMIASNLSIKDILNVYSTSKQFKEVCGSDLFWEVITNRDVGSILVPAEEADQRGSNIYKKRANILKRENEKLLKGCDSLRKNPPSFFLYPGPLTFYSSLWTYLPKADLDNVDSSGNTFVKAHLFKASLRNANLDRAKFIKANLFNADLAGASLTDTDLSEALLEGADLSNAFVRNTNFSNANLMSANFTESVVSDRTNFSDANLRYALFRGVVFPNKVNLSGANLSGSDFIEAKTDVTTEEDFEVYRAQGIWYTVFKPVTKEWLKKQGAIWDENNPPKVIESEFSEQTEVQMFDFLEL